MFPPMVVQMMAVGEETGALDEMLDKIADFYDQEVEATVDALTSLIEPLLIVVMGVVRRRHDHQPLPADVQHHQAHQVTHAEHALQPVRPPANSNWRRVVRSAVTCDASSVFGRRGSAGGVEEVPERAGEVRRAATVMWNSSGSTTLSIVEARIVRGSRSDATMRSVSATMSM